MADDSKTNIVMRVDRSLWRRFKVHAVDSDLTMTQFLEEMITWFLRGVSSEGAEKKATPAVGRRRRRTLESAERPAERRLDEELARYAARFGIKDENEESLREKVLDAIAEEYRAHADEEGWTGDNLPMLEWHNRGGV